MRRVMAVVAAAAWWMSGSAFVSASGPLGIYGIIERVVFEPDERNPQRVQIWGAFAYADLDAPGGTSPSPIRRGYLYFRLPEAGRAAPQTVRREWHDLRSVAGSGQAVAFGRWGYVGWFGGLLPDRQADGPPHILEQAPGGGTPTDVRVRPASEPPSNPAAYATNTGVVKLSASGSHAALVAALRNALRP